MHNSEISVYHVNNPLTDTARAIAYKLYTNIDTFIIKVSINNVNSSVRHICILVLQ